MTRRKTPGSGLWLGPRARSRGAGATTRGRATSGAAPRARLPHRACRLAARAGRPSAAEKPLKVVIESFEPPAQIKDDMENVCFICGIDRFTFDTSGDGFEKHIRNDHW